MCKMIFLLVLSILCGNSALALQIAKTGGIQGRVVEAKSGEPVKKAVVILKRGNEPGTGAYTDTEGRFSFQKIEPAAYTVSAEREGFVTDPESERSVVTVKPDSTESGVLLKLLRTGAISGRVLDADGEPVTGAGVQVLSLRQKKGRPAATSWATTNDRGEYRAFNVAPGKYRIATSYTPKIAHMEVKMQNGPEETYATTFYPGTLDARQAAVVQVDPGADLQGFDVQLLRAKGVRVRGRVSGPGGRSPGPFVMVSLDPIGAQASAGDHRSTLVRGTSGEFELGHVLPGRYVLTAEAVLDEGKLAARQILDVDESDIDGVQLTLAAPQKITGAVIVPQERKVPEGLIVALERRERLDSQAGGMAQVGSDGKFTMPDVAPGDYDVILGNIGAGDDLYISSIRMGGHDALAEGLRVGGSTLAPLEITLKPNGGALECLVSGPDQKPLPGAQAVLLPDPPQRLQIALHAQCQTEANGMCTMLGVTPGEYRAFGFEAGAEFDFLDPEVMKGLQKHGKPVKIGEGDRARVELKAVPVER